MEKKPQLFKKGDSSLIHYMPARKRPILLGFETQGRQASPESKTTVLVAPWKYQNPPYLSPPRPHREPHLGSQLLPPPPLPWHPYLGLLNLPPPLLTVGLKDYNIAVGMPLESRRRTVLFFEVFPLISLPWRWLFSSNCFYFSVEVWFGR